MIKRVWEVCELHPDVFARDIDPSTFAASLHAVASGIAEPDYADAARFFTKTYMTRSLAGVLEGVWARLMGLSTSGAPIRRLETPFGGGKTHTMVALYHLAQSPEAVEATEAGTQLLERLNIRQLPRNVRVAVLDGVALEVGGRTVNGLTLHTLWGELAYLLGGSELYAMVREADIARIAPGQPLLSSLLQRAAPVLILMDEVMHYLAKAGAVKVNDTNLSVQTIAFLRELTAAVDEVANAALVLSLPASSLEIPEESARAEEIYQRVRKVLGRNELIETPVDQDEVFGVLKRRLFRTVGTPQQAKQVVEAYLEYYGQYPSFFPEKLHSADYRQRMIDAYPFHPELVDMLYQRWGAHPQFQRTRGALRLLALVLRRLWDQRPGAAYLIQPYHIDLADRRVRAEVIRLLENTFDTIASKDIAEHARAIDRELGDEYEREMLARGAATCAFLSSVSGGSKFVGLTEEELRVALLRPEVNPALLSEVLKRLQNRLWYLRYREQRYFFLAKPNLNKVILDHEQSIDEGAVNAKIAARLQVVSGRGASPLSVVMASSNEDTFGEPSQATLVLLPLSIDDAESWMRAVVERMTRRNLLIFLAPDKGTRNALRVEARRLLALEAVQKTAAFQEFDKEDQHEVGTQVKNKQDEVDGLLVRTYSRVYRPAAEGVQEVRLTLKPSNKTLSSAVYEALKERGELLESLSPDFLASVMGNEQKEVSLTQIETVFMGAPGQPVLIRPRETIREAIQSGVEQGRFAVAVEGRTYTETVPNEVLSSTGAKVVLEPAATLLVEEPASDAPPKRMRLQVDTRAHNLYPIRKMLDSLQGTPIQITLTLADDSGALNRQRDTLDTLLKDYGVSHAWAEDELGSDS